MPDVEFIDWKGRAATRLSNGLIEFVVLTSGGHLAEFQFVEQSDGPSQNVLWEAPWATSDLKSSNFQALCMDYGLTEVGKFLAGFTGHALCLDYFGSPSLSEAAAGLALHGEAAAANWNAVFPVSKNSISCQWNVQLPVAQLKFERKIRLGNQESVVYVEERVTNERDLDHDCHWVQHATFGPPFLNAAESVFIVSANRGMTSPFDYEGCSLLESNREFHWPYAPLKNARGIVDLRQPFSTEGLGFLVAIQLDPSRETQYIVAVNRKLGLGMGYCFRRADFPWMTIWEENYVRKNAPWNGQAQVRGMEFGTTPLPLGRKEILRTGNLFDTPGFCSIPARESRAARYCIFLFTIPIGITSIHDVEARGDTLVLYGNDPDHTFSIPAHGCEDFLSIS